jgi:hypothetical protein
VEPETLVTPFAAWFDRPRTAARDPRQAIERRRRERAARVQSAWLRSLAGPTAAAGQNRTVKRAPPSGA